MELGVVSSKLRGKRSSSSLVHHPAPAPRPRRATPWPPCNRDGGKPWPTRPKCPLPVYRWRGSLKSCASSYTNSSISSSKDENVPSSPPASELLALPSPQLSNVTSVSPNGAANRMIHTCLSHSLSADRSGSACVLREVQARSISTRSLTGAHSPLIIPARNWKLKIHIFPYPQPNE